MNTELTETRKTVTDTFTDANGTVTSVIVREYNLIEKCQCTSCRQI